MNDASCPILQVKDLKKTFVEGSVSTDVIKGVSFSLNAGEMVAVVGSSGSGKSTLLHMLGTLDRPTSGEILYRGVSVGGYSSDEQADFRNKHLGFVYQFHHLLGEFSAIENVAMPLLIAGVPDKETWERSEKMLDMVGLSHRASHRPSELSGGERQRVAIARALVNRPELVLADEPTGNLDHATAQEIFDLMVRVHEETGTAFLVVTHDLELASRFGRRIVIRDGAIADE